jgi:hypothetical protein
MMALSCRKPRPRVVTAGIAGLMMARPMGRLGSASMMGMRARPSGGGGGNKQHGSRANAQCD